jgi:hypothetical protein
MIQKETDQVRGTHILEMPSGGTSQDPERNRPSSALTPWRPHREGEVSTQKETERASGTHALETASKGKVSTLK